MAAANKLTIYSTDGQKLQSAMAFYIRDTMKKSRVNPSGQAPAVFVPEYISTSRANNNCLVSPDTKSDGVTQVGVLRTRQNSPAKPGDVYPVVKNYTLSETLKGRETFLDAVVRGLKEELGSLVDRGFFHDLGPGSGYALVVAPGAKNRILNNYQRIVPLTELYDVQWVAHRGAIPAAPNIVQDTDVYESDMIAIIDATLAAPLPPSRPTEEGDPVMTDVTDPVSRPNADHRVVRPAPVMPRQIGAAPAAPALPPPPPPAAPVVKPSLGLVAPGTTAVVWPPKNEGETKEQYIKRVVGMGPGKTPAATRAHADTIFTGGRKTIRRKKSKQPKKRGTLKRGVRRSH